MENSSLKEFLDKSNKNFYNKQGSAEYSSMIPEIQDMIDQMYKNIPSYNYYNIDEMPNLDSYNVNYSSEAFKLFEKNFNERREIKEEIVGFQRQTSLK